MMSHKQVGFTIVELILVMSITAVLAVGILAGSGFAIAQQRYRDAGVSLQAFLQQQYVDVTNTINDRSDDMTCDSGANVSSGNALSDRPRGASECVILGRMVKIINGGKTLQVNPVIGYTGLNQSPVSTDMEAFEQYAIAWTDTAVEIKEVDWQAELDKLDGSTADHIILILRSPYSGVIRTFVTNSVEIPGNEITYAALEHGATGNNQQTVLCLVPDGWQGTGGRLGVIIRENATTRSAIELDSEGSGC